MHRRSRSALLLKAFGMALASGSAGVACTEGAVDNLAGGDDAIQIVAAPRVPRFELATQLGDVALLGRGERVYMVATSTAVTNPSTTVGRSAICVKHPVQLLYPPTNSSNTVLAEGVVSRPAMVEGQVGPVSRTRVTAIHGVGTAASRHETFEFPAPLAGSVMVGDRLLAFTKFGPAGRAQCPDFTGADDGANAGVTFLCDQLPATENEPGSFERTIVADISPTNARAFEVPFEIGALYTTAGGTYVVASTSPHELLELRDADVAQPDAGVMAPGGAELGAPLLDAGVDAGDAGVLPLGEESLTTRSCKLETGQCGIVIVRADGCSAHAVQAPATDVERSSQVACANAWSSVAVSANGCAAAIVQKQTGQALIIPLPGPECPAVLHRRIDAARLTQPAEGDFRIVLSPDARWAAIHPTGTSEVPVTLISTTDSTPPLDTPLRRPQGIEFACNATSGDCTLWARPHEGDSMQLVSAIRASDGALTSCASQLPVRQLHVASSEWATFIGTDSNGTVNLMRVDVGSGCASGAPLAFMPVCLGVADANHSFACSDERDGRVELITWGDRPHVPPIGQFSLENRSSEGGCQ